MLHFLCSLLYLCGLHFQNVQFILVQPCLYVIELLESGVHLGAAFTNISWTSIEVRAWVGNYNSQDIVGCDNWQTNITYKA